MSTPLTPEDRSTVLRAVLRALEQACPERFSEQERTRSGGIDELNHHLDSLIEIVRQSTATRIEPFQAQILESVCSRCPHQLASGYCILRDVDRCILYSHARVVVDALAQALSELRDPEYLMFHTANERPVAGDSAS